MQDANVPTISLDSTLRLHPLSKQQENGVVIIGRGDRFLELPPEGLQFIAWLNEGLPLNTAKKLFEERYNPFPEEEVIDVVQAFLSCDFIASIDNQPVAVRKATPKSNVAWFPRQWAEALFSKPMLLLWMALTVTATVLWVTTPDLWPKRADYFWANYYSFIVLTAMLLWLGGMAMHELSHWLACRAKGIDATITWTQRLGFFPMSQTIMHNIWAVPRTARFLPLAAGMMWDVFSISLVIYVLYFNKIGILVLPWLAVKILKFYLLLITMGITSQFWLFSKMDGYFLLSSLLGQRNLQSDTYQWLKSKVSKAASFVPPVSGMKFIYIYTVVAVLWGGLFMARFLSVDLMIKLQLLWDSFSKIIHQSSVSSTEFADGVGVFLSQVLYWSLLIYAYWRDPLSNWRNRNVTTR